MIAKTERSAGVKWIPLALAMLGFVGIGALLAFGFSKVQGTGGPARVTEGLERAPDFTVPLYSGGAGEFTLSEQRGHPVVVNFWGSWCPPCRAEFPALQAAADRYSDEGLVVFGVDVQDTEEDARAFLKQQGTTFKTGPDRDGSITLDYGVTGMPTTFFVTSDGKIFKKWVGQISEEKLVTLVDELLAL